MNPLVILGGGALLLGGIYLLSRKEEPKKQEPAPAPKPPAGGVTLPGIAGDSGGGFMDDWLNPDRGSSSLGTYEPSPAPGGAPSGSYASPAPGGAPPPDLGGVMPLTTQEEQTAFAQAVLGADTFESTDPATYCSEATKRADKYNGGLVEFETRKFSSAIMGAPSKLSLLLVTRCLSLQPSWQEGWRAEVRKLLERCAKMRESKLPITSSSDPSFLTGAGLGAALIDRCPELLTGWKMTAKDYEAMRGTLPVFGGAGT